MSYLILMSRFVIYKFIVLISYLLFLLDYDSIPVDTSMDALVRADSYENFNLNPEDGAEGTSWRFYIICI